MPLSTIRVLDLTRLLPGPYCTMILADFGAEVIKVEEPNVGDYAREEYPRVDEDSAVFHSLNRNKKSICLDLKTKDGKDNFLKLVKNADVVVESFRPGVMKRLGLDYDTLNEINPRIIYCAITGYGQTGPYVNKPGHDVNYISYSGLLGMMGERNKKPIIPATQTADIGGGAYPAAVGILLALFGRDRTGKGQMVDISMMDGMMTWLPSILPAFLISNEYPKRGEFFLSGGRACYEVYQTKDEKWMSVGALELKFWAPFCKKIGREDFIEKLNAPIDVQEKMKVEIQNIISKKTLDKWMKIFSEIDSCVAPVYSIEEVVQDPQVKARDMIVEIPHKELGTVKQVGIPIKLSNTPGRIRDLAPKLGEHTEEIIKDISI